MRLVKLFFRKLKFSSMAYVADTFFKSSTGKTYHQGEEITEYQYENLPQRERGYFSRKKDIDYGSSYARDQESQPSPFPGFLSPEFGPAPDPVQETPSFDGWGGGSGGGAGATDSYEAPSSPSYDAPSSCDSSSFSSSDSGGGFDGGGGGGFD